jgi:hypothetical protein
LVFPSLAIIRESRATFEGIEGLPSSAESQVPSRQRIIRFGIVAKEMRTVIRCMWRRIQAAKKKEGREKTGIDGAGEEKYEKTGHTSSEGDTGVLPISPQWPRGMTSSIVPY